MGDPLFHLTMFLEMGGGKALHNKLEILKKNNKILVMLASNLAWIQIWEVENK
jgi:hypothetical protein